MLPARAAQHQGGEARAPGLRGEEVRAAVKIEFLYLEHCLWDCCEGLGECCIPLLVGGARGAVTPWCVGCALGVSLQLALLFGAVVGLGESATRLGMVVLPCLRH